MLDYKPYNPNSAEGEIYALWEESGLFNPDVCMEKSLVIRDASTFSIVLPPPNVTGTLHTGHALMLAIEDALVRFNRMRGKRTLWVPGVDHAAIATQAKVEKILSREGISKHTLGREAFVQKVEDFALASHDTIVHQIRKMGASVDWSREAYTLDEKRSLAVRTAFVGMYEAGLIYRGDRVVNWDVKGQTTVSDEEVIYEEEKGWLYTFKYSPDFPIPIATTRPETKVGDTAVAIHPRDERYSEYVGKTYEVEFCQVSLKIKVVSDESVDPEYGTGAVGITPAHSQIDFELAKKHDLSLSQVIDEKGRMIVEHPHLNGMKTLEARDYIVKQLEEKSLLIGKEEITINLSKAQRSGGVIEPLPKKQWFVSVNSKFKINESQRVSRAVGRIDPEPVEGSQRETTLKNLMREAVESGKIKILPERFENNYFHWIGNLRDWCISRQIWFGHRIPVWYRFSRPPELVEGSQVNELTVRAEGDPSTLVGMTPDDSQEIYVGIEPPTGSDWVQDPDTLDTWFSSGLWTFSTLGWPESDADLKTYHPTSVLETGYDILFFWVARMILMSGFLLGEVPFHTVYLHGMVRDAKGRKMSKSLDNALDPLEFINQFGADALRLAMIFGTGVGNDQTLGEEKVKGMRNFVNKVFNISRFIQMSGAGSSQSVRNKPELLSEDQEILNRSREVSEKVANLMEEYRLSEALQILYDFVWHEFASSYLEGVKNRLREGESDSSRAAIWTLKTVFLAHLKLLHPFMPFVTEWLYQDWRKFDPGAVEREYLMVEKWPVLAN